MGFEFIEAGIRDGLGTITLNRPPVNILNIAMMEEINGVLKDWQGERDMKALLIDAKGKCFSAGVDVGEHTGDLAPKMIEAFHGMFRLLDGFEIPTVASAYGSCLGGGCELAVFCDMVIASDDLKIGQPEIQVGVFPPIAAQIFPRIIGRKAAIELILSGKVIGPDEALRLGLLNKVVSRDELEAETGAFVKPFLKLSAEVLRKTKKAIFAGLRDDLEDSLVPIEKIYLDELMKTEDAQEGLKAFLEKRKPEWKNR
ncbi:MAG: enoyl-CoA hydratase/isomerase family protein [Thermodesulfobacteriota bacterium]